jgi:mRNA interferase RelE/StbE
VRYRIEFTQKAFDQFAHLPEKTQAKLSSEIDTLSDEPRPHGARKITGLDDCYRIRYGDYRLIYAVIDECLVVLIVRAGHRKDVYKNMSNLYRDTDK